MAWPNLLKIKEIGAVPEEPHPSDIEGSFIGGIVPEVLFEACRNIAILANEVSICGMNGGLYRPGYRAHAAVIYQTVDGTAAAGRDYLAASAS